MRCGLLGRKLGHSYSPAIHRAFGGYSYELFEREPDEVAAFLKGGEWDGLNVTVPYKRTVIPYLGELSAAARETGSVNTIVRRADGTLFGDNTDVYGFLETVRETGIDPAGKKALILGSGGASRAVRAALLRLGAEPVTISRSGPETYETIDRHKDAAILVNATPVGMYPENGASPLDGVPAGDGGSAFDLLPALEIVFDAIYNPARTKLLWDAEKRAIRAKNGLTMLVRQAAASSALFTGVPVPEETVRETEEALLRGTRNVVLIGMPGCGKTSVGRELARMTGRELADTDEMIEERTGMTVPRFFETYGEDAFRALETELLGEAGKRSGIVIATGGGCVTRPENELLLRQNGAVVWLRRDLKKLPREGRPLSLAGSLEALYEERKPLYGRFMDIAVDNGGTVPEAARAVMEELL